MEKLLRSGNILKKIICVIQILIEGARRVGKSTIVREFAKNEYKSYAIFDFSKATKGEKSLFDDLSDMDYFFSRLRVLKDVTLYQRDTVIIFDEVQKYPIARQAIKALVEDGRYDYIETGSLISIHKNTENNNHNYEIDFLLSRGNKICPIEVKSSGYKSHKSLDEFCHTYSHRISSRYLVYTKDLRKDGETLLVPVYMAELL